MSDPTPAPTDITVSNDTTEAVSQTATTVATTTTPVTSTSSTPTSVGIPTPPPTTTTTNTIPRTAKTVPKTTPVIRLCPELNVPHSVINSGERNLGSIVRLRCETDSHLTGPSILLCQKNGNWNGSLPICTGSEHGIPLSTKLFIGVLTGCCGVILLVVVAILIKLWFCSGKKKAPSRFSDRHHRLPRSSFDNLPPAPNPVQYQTHDRRYNVYQESVGKNKSETDSVTYAKPEIYSTFINPTFYEGVYERWRRRESEDHYNAETLYDSPWAHSKRPDEEESDDGSNMRWSSVSLRAHDNYDYGRFGKIPRSQVGLTAVSATDDNTTF